MKKKILFILPWLPYPLKTGGHQAIFNGIHVIRDYFEIYISYRISVRDRNVEDERAFLDVMGENCHIFPFEEVVKRNTIWRRGINKIIRGLNRLLSQKYKSEIYEWWHEQLSPMPVKYVQHIRKIIDEYKIEVVQAEMLRNISIVYELPPGLTKIFVHHEIGFVRHELELEPYRKTPSWSHAMAFLHESKLLEIGLLNLYDKVVTLSPIDGDKLEEAGVQSEIYNSFAIVQSESSLCEQKKECFQLSFVGPDRHEPNFDGIKWFLGNCWEELLKYDKRYQLQIIGLWSPRHIEEFEGRYKNIKFLGFVKDLRGALENSIMIVPIKIGSGIRMKILEACSNGIPFVSTSVGAEGIPVVNGENCLLADEPKDFIQAIIEMGDLKKREKFIVSANEMVQKHYSIEALKKNRLEMYWGK